MFDQFPKERSILPEAYKKIYIEQYKSNRKGESKASSLSQKLERWLHKKVSEDVKHKTTDIPTLEIGAGTLNHLQHENTSPYDIIEPFKELFIDSSEITKVRNIYSDISEIADDTKYDRIISIATFEHILNLTEVVAKTCLMLNNNGSLRVSIPNEGYFMWRLGWTVSTGLEFYLKYKLKYKVMIEHEHVNNANEINEVLRYFYDDVKVSYFVFNKYFSLYRFYACKNPKINLATEFLKQYYSSL